MLTDPLWRKHLHNRQGVALLLVISSIALLSWLLADFTFETSVNKIKAYNGQDKLQAKLNAQAGLNFALAKLRLYKEARNLLEKNKQAKKTIKPGAIEKVVLTPFIYPIPLPKNAGAIQKTALEEFTKNTLIKGQLAVSISSIKGFLNPNNLRTLSRQNGEEKEDSSNQKEENQKTPQEYIEEKLLATLKSSIEEKSENDEIFDELYGTLDPNLLIKELKFYVNNPKAINDPEKIEIESLYAERGITPKHAPMTSLDELYLLEGWPDDIVDLIKDRLTVHEVSVIAINKITKEQLKIIFPKLDPIQIEEFFKYRDGDQELQEDPHPFESEQEFKTYLVETLGVPEDTYTSRTKEFERAGLRFGTAGNLYKVVSTGTFERSSYTITAFIDLPIKPKPKLVKKKKKRKNEPPLNPHDPPPPDEKKKKKEPEPLEFMEPRVVEIRLG